MFDKKELEFIKLVLNQLNFKTGQKELFLITEQILEKIKLELNVNGKKKND